ncbi:MAG: putative sulfate exporter family transporter [Anaerolineales bacterium]
MTNEKSKQQNRELSTWEKNLLGVPVNDVPKLIPGFFAVSILAWFSIWLSKFIGVNLLGFEKSPVSPVMLAILLGLIISAVIPLPASLKPGLSFAVKKVLRLGIILLGIRLTIFDVFRLGLYGIPIVVICIIGALVITTQVNKWLKLPPRLGALIAVGTSICGVSAIVATSPAIEAEEEETAYAVAVITIFGLLATLIYPYAANVIFAGNAMRVGLWLGTSIHDTSQVVGAAKVYADIFSQPLALDVATVTKLVRNVFMVLVIPFMAYYYARNMKEEDVSKSKVTNPFKLLPLFILGFLAMAVIRSIGDAGIRTSGVAFGLWDTETWTGIIKFITNWAGNFLVVALAGVGLSTKLSTFRGLGLKPFVVGLCAALAVGVVSFITITVIGSLVTL